MRLGPSRHCARPGAPSPLGPLVAGVAGPGGKARGVFCDLVPGCAETVRWAGKLACAGWATLPSRATQRWVQVAPVGGRGWHRRPGRGPGRGPRWAWGAGVHRRAPACARARTRAHACACAHAHKRARVRTPGRWSQVVPRPGVGPGHRRAPACARARTRAHACARARARRRACVRTPGLWSQVVPRPDGPLWGPGRRGALAAGVHTRVRGWWRTRSERGERRAQRAPSAASAASAERSEAHTPAPPRPLFSRTGPGACARTPGEAAEGYPQAHAPAPLVNPPRSRRARSSGQVCPVAHGATRRARARTRTGWTVDPPVPGRSLRATSTLLRSWPVLRTPHLGRVPTSRSRPGVGGERAASAASASAASAAPPRRAQRAPSRRAKRAPPRRAQRAVPTPSAASGPHAERSERPPRRAQRAAPHAERSERPPRRAQRAAPTPSAASARVRARAAGTGCVRLGGLRASGLDPDVGGARCARSPSTPLQATHAACVRPVKVWTCCTRGTQT